MANGYPEHNWDEDTNWYKAGNDPLRLDEDYKPVHIYPVVKSEIRDDIWGGVFTHYMSLFKVGRMFGDDSTQVWITVDDNSKYRIPCSRGSHPKSEPHQITLEAFK